MSKEKSYYSLSDFIKNSLLEINKGVKEAKDLGVPLAHEQYESGVHPRAKTVNFDIALTIENKADSEKSTGGNFAISVLGARVGKKESEVNSSKDVHRIQFSIDVFIGGEGYDNSSSDF